MPADGTSNQIIVHCIEICKYMGLLSMTYAIRSWVMPLVETGQIKMSIPRRNQRVRSSCFTVNRRSNDNTMDQKKSDLCVQSTHEKNEGMCIMLSNRYDIK